MKVATLAVTASLLLLPLSASASETPQDIIDQLPDSAWAASITLLQEGITPLSENITVLQTNVVEVERQTTEGEETVISLVSDILFAFDEATVPTDAQAVLEEVVSEIPDGATVDVQGHTDSRADDAYNQDLSERRAQAVADLLAQVRPDLTFQVEGFGESRPVEPNETAGEDNPEGRALNRRVEIRYEG